MIIGLGTDLVSLSRIRRVIERHPTRFVQKIMTNNERAVFEGMSSIDMAAAYVAKQFAAKEAVSKALGLGMRGGVQFNLIEVARSASGQPRVLLLGGALARAEALDILSWHLSLTDDSGFAVAVAIAEG